MNTDDTTRKVIAEQFAEDWLLIADNNSQEFYNELKDTTEELDNLVALSTHLQDEWETLVEQVDDVVTRHISPLASEFIRQIIGGQGSLPFDLIAKELLSRKEAN
jgi:metal-responsive CopG/Arc/MetJ family transcriptional regulator